MLAGGFRWPVAAGDSQPMISIFCRFLGRLLVPVIAFSL